MEETIDEDESRHAGGVCLVDSINTCQAAVVINLTVTVQAVDEQKQSYLTLD